MGKPMDGIQQQVNELNSKVDRLFQVVEQLSRQIEVVTEKPAARASEKNGTHPSFAYSAPQSLASNGRFQSAMEHKDILMDDHDSNKLIADESEFTLSSDLQVRRLTAQLTAAYNRIAALEEQVLACRMHY